MTTKKTKTSRLPYDHALDLPVALRELDKLLRGWNKDAPWPLLPRPGNATLVSASALLHTAHDIEALATQLREVAARVYTAERGKRQATRFLAQLREARKAA